MSCYVQAAAGIGDKIIPSEALALRLAALEHKKVGTIPFAEVERLQMRKSKSRPESVTGERQDPT